MNFFLWIWYDETAEELPVFFSRKPVWFGRWFVPVVRRCSFWIDLMAVDLERCTWNQQMSQKLATDYDTLRSGLFIAANACVSRCLGSCLNVHGEQFSCRDFHEYSQIENLNGNFFNFFVGNFIGVSKMAKVFFWISSLKIFGGSIALKIKIPLKRFKFEWSSKSFY